MSFSRLFIASDSRVIVGHDRLNILDTRMLYEVDNQTYPGLIVLRPLGQSAMPEKGYGSKGSMPEAHLVTGQCFLTIEEFATVT